DDLGVVIDWLNDLIEDDKRVIVIEHNLRMMREGEWFMDIGGYGGDKGGEVLYSGEAGGVLNIKN
ncbi:P-loop NTPase family protein, partial [Staphylococcus capitis]|uniref:hypothetical protein n=1 Tax=Staphylococcus capitis TaxID=29388 RepID=UPI001642F758